MAFARGWMTTVTRGATAGAWVTAGQAVQSQVTDRLPFLRSGVGALVRDFVVTVVLGLVARRVRFVDGDLVSAGIWSAWLRDVVTNLAPGAATTLGLAGYTPLRAYAALGNYSSLAAYTENAPDYASIGPLGDVVREPHVESFYSGGMGDGE